MGARQTKPPAMVYDLADSFNRVNDRYFAGQMSRPTLTWSQSLTFRKFGHYDHCRDTVMISSTLDQRQVPEFVLDFIVFHELLHKELPTRWNGNRRSLHGPEFKSSEQRFKDHEKAKAALSRIARRHRS